LQRGIFRTHTLGVNFVERFQKTGFAPDAWRFSRWVVGLTAATLVGCARPPEPDTRHPVDSGIIAESMFSETVFAAEKALFEHWRLVPIRGSGDWTLSAGPEERLSIAGTAEDSASGIFLDVDIDPVACPVLEWRWQVDNVQESADLRKKAGDDVAAAIFVVFGDAGSPIDPRPVPTLRYVWTNERHRPGEIIANPYLPSVVHNVVVRTGPAGGGAWRTERRNMLSDYEAAFGERPEDVIWSIALFVDNDQTGEPAAARFRNATLYCR